MANIRQNDAKAYKHIRRILRGNEPEIDTYHPKNPLLPIAGAVLVFLVVMWLITGCARAYTEQEAIRTIVGESSNQGYKGMICVAEVIRHNSSLRGFYGLHASHSLREGAKTWAMAKKAWFASLNTNYTRGANHFENINAFGQPYWVKKCIKTYTWKDHVFYKGA